MINAKENSLSEKDLNQLEEQRIEKLNKNGIDELDILEQARKDKNEWQNYFSENLTQGRADIKFLYEDQWSSIERNEFNRLGKVCFTANKMRDTVNKIKGEQRKNKPDLMVRSLTGHASQEIINLRTDLIRTICYKSQNDLIYQHAFGQALTLGWGAFQVDVDYESPRTFRKAINFLLIPDARLTSFDPSAIKPHKGDGNTCSRDFIYTREQFNAMFPYIINPVSYADPRVFLDFQWENKECIVICDYYAKEWYSFKLLHLSNGMDVTEDEWDEIQKYNKLRKELAVESDITKDIILSLNPSIVMERQTADYDIMHYRLIKDKIIDFSRWPSKQLPIIFVDGNSTLIEGKQRTASFIHEGKDSQKFINFVLSERATEIKNRRREQWLGTVDNIIGNEQVWRNPEQSMGLLIAKPDPKTGAMPIKAPAWELSGEMLQEYQSATQDLKEILGYSESEELQGRDISGKARRERKIEGSMAAYVQYDNLQQAIEQAGRLVLDLLPYVIGNDERHMVITKKDGKSESVIMNKKNTDGTIDNSIGDGDFDIEIATGPSFAVQKEMALEFFQQTVAASGDPNVFKLVADLWAKNLDIQFMQQVSDRFKTMVPPEVLAKEEGKEPPPPQPNPQDQMMQMEMEFKKQEMQLKEQKLQSDQEELSLRQQAHQLEKERHELDKMDMLVKAKKMNSDMAMNAEDRKINAHKTNLDYSAKMAKVMADLHSK